MNLNTEAKIVTPRCIHAFLYRFKNFNIYQNKRIAKIVFVSGTHIEPMIFPTAFTNEIIPIIWDCWPYTVNNVVKALKRCKVKMAIFTSSQSAEIIKKYIPTLDVVYMPEAIDTKLYHKGKRLSSRNIDLLEFGRTNRQIHEMLLKANINNHLYSKNGEKLFEDFNDFAINLANSKIVITLPRCDTHPELAGNIETLTQRYWECMISRNIMLGRAPKELVDLIGYNPVITIDDNSLDKQIKHILDNLSDYQELVDKNYQTALQYGDWQIRIKELSYMLYRKGYNCFNK